MAPVRPAGRACCRTTAARQDLSRPSAARLTQRRALAATAHEPPAEDEWHHAERDEPDEVPRQRVRAVDPDAVDAERPVGQDAVDDVPEAEADHQRPDQPPARRLVTPPARPPQAPQAEGGDHIHQRVEDTVPQHLPAQVTRPGHEAQQVVPLQDLVQQDAVEEAAEPEAQHHPPARPCQPRRSRHATPPSRAERRRRQDVPACRGPRPAHLTDHSAPRRRRSGGRPVGR